ncbi:hypothetical protein Zm00014a_025507 [Zea mays]|uniref:Uncharacterized protein n=1 Tax=Zea mays TaxID=4577 RepID=A0A3L6FR27_MAIZE|nr:hypothetical protein Zm00014a_025507 [Zea mays]
MCHPRDGVDVEPHQVAHERLVHYFASERVARAGAVHEHVDVKLPEELPERVGLGGEAVAGEVEHEGADLDAGAPGPGLGRHGGELVGDAAPEDEPEARRGQAERERAADAVSGARDDCPRAVAAAQRPRGSLERRVQPQRQAGRGVRGQQEPHQPRESEPTRARSTPLRPWEWR